MTDRGTKSQGTSKSVSNFLLFMPSSAQSAVESPPVSAVIPLPLQTQLQDGVVFFFGSVGYTASTFFKHTN